MKYLEKSFTVALGSKAFKEGYEKAFKTKKTTPKKKKSSSKRSSITTT